MTIDHRARPERRRLLVLSLTLALAVLATGCDGATDAVEDAADSGAGVEDQPQEALQSAVDALGDWEGIEAAFRLDADDDVRTEAMADGELTEDEVDRLLGSSIEMRAGGLDDPDAAGFEAAVVVDGSSVLDLQVSGDERFFVRVDAQALSRLSGDVELGDLDDLVGSARMFGLGDVAQAAADGRWVELIGIDNVMELAGAGATAETEEPEVDEEEREALNIRIITTFERFLDEDVTVSYVGSDDVGEQVRMTTDGASLEALVGDLKTEFDRAGLLEDAGAGELDDLDVDPDMVVSIDAWIQSGELRQLAVDLNALDEDDQLPGELLLIVTLEEFTGTVTEPDDAEPFDVLTLVGAFLGGMGDDAFGPGDLSGTGDAEGFGDDLSGELDEEEPLGESDPEAPVGDEGGRACISEEELDLIEEFGDTEEMGQLEELFDTGVLERC